MKLYNYPSAPEQFIFFCAALRLRTVFFVDLCSVSTLEVWYTFQRLGAEEADGRGREASQEPRDREGHI